MFVIKMCFKCGVEKPLSEFYKHKAMGDGHLNKCKECTKQDVNKHRNLNIDSIREYDRSRGNTSKRIEARIEYLKTSKGKLSKNKASSAYADRHPEKITASAMVYNAVRGGRLWKAPCCMSPECFSTVNIQGHHHSYGQPLDVNWLCSKCHSSVHKQHREYLRSIKQTEEK